MHALISHNPVLVVAAAAIALLVSAVLVAVVRVMFRLFAITAQAAVVMAAARLLIGLVPIIGLLLAAFVYLRR